ncbi:hypothetical protein CCACVL1_01833, partial [Corchorus capsularis]
GSSNSSVLTEAGEKQAERCNKPLQICTLINALQVQYPALRFSGQSKPLYTIQ